MVCAQMAQPFLSCKEVMIEFMHVVALDITSCFAIGLALPEDFYVQVHTPCLALWLLVMLVGLRPAVGACTITACTMQQLSHSRALEGEASKVAWPALESCCTLIMLQAPLTQVLPVSATAR